MHARLFTMSIGPGQRDLWTALAKEHFTFCKSLPGFVSANYCMFDEFQGGLRRADGMAKCRRW